MTSQRAATSEQRPANSSDQPPDLTCAACVDRSRRKGAVLCGSCKQRWHLSCAKLTKAQASNLPSWHCLPCLGRQSASSTRTDPADVPASISEGLARLRSGTKVVSRIPKPVRPLVADALATELEEATRNPSAQSWWRFLSFAYKALRAPRPSSGGARVTAATTIRRAVAGLNESHPEPDEMPRGSRDPSSPDADDAIARRVRAKCADGDVRAALRILTSNDTFAEPNAEVISALRAKHPAAPADESLPPAPSASDPAPLTVTAEEVEAAIFTMPPGSSAGLDGIRPLHLRQLVSREAAESGRRLLIALTNLTNRVLAGQVPKCGRDALFGASLCALRKKDGGLRPIAVGSVFRRLPARIGARHMASLLGAELRPVQLGVGTPLGCEAAVHATRSFIQASTEAAIPQVLVKVDVRNAFNTIRRDVFLARIRERCPEVYPLAYQAYSAPTPLHIGGQTILSSSGVQQGDPLGPAAFALAVDPCAQAITSPLNAWYLDDATIAGPADTVAADLRSLRSALSAVGLTLNAAKCEVAFLGNPLTSHPAVSLEAISAALPDAAEIQLNNLSLLGSPLTDGGLEAAADTASDMIERLCSRLRHLDSHTAVFFLAHHVSAPRLSYLLRSAPLYKEPEALDRIDETVRSTLEAVTNVTISGESWEQATLPVRLGGLGVRSVGSLALPCHVASLHASLPLMRNICPRSCDDETPSTLQSAVQLFEERAGVKSQESPTGDSATSQRDGTPSAPRPAGIA